MLLWIFSLSHSLSHTLAARSVGLLCFCSSCSQARHIYRTKVNTFSVTRTFRYILWYIYIYSIQIFIISIIISPIPPHLHFGSMNLWDWSDEYQQNWHRKRSLTHAFCINIHGKPYTVCCTVCESMYTNACYHTYRFMYEFRCHTSNFDCLAFGGFIFGRSNRWKFFHQRYFEWMYGFIDNFLPSWLRRP